MRSKQRLCLLATTTAAAVAVAGCKRSAEDVVTFAGSSTIMPLMLSLEDVFASHSIKIRVQGGGSSVGVRSIRNDLALLAMVSRDLTEKEDAEFEHVTIARDAVAIILHAHNPLDRVDRDLIRSIYAGRKATWDNGQRITVVNKEAGRATLKVFEKYFDLNGQIRKDAVIIGANGQAVASVARDPNSIAYVSLGDAKAAVDGGESIKIVALDGVHPEVNTIASGEYKLSRPLNLAYKSSASMQVKPVFDLFGAETVREKIRERNFVPVL